MSRTAGGAGGRPGWRAAGMIALGSIWACGGPGEPPAEPKPGAEPEASPAGVIVWDQPDPAAPRAWRELGMADLEVDLEIFEPIRARYLQTMYDLDGEQDVQSRTVVHLDLDHAVHSGPWDGQLPVALEPHREPGLVVVWQVQNGYYNAFDRVLTGRHLQMKGRIMPASSFGWRVGFVADSGYTAVVFSPDGSDRTLPIERRPVETGGLNVLTYPYALAAMELEMGERFTFPGDEMVGGSDGGGTSFTGAVSVRRTGTGRWRGRSIEVAEVELTRMDARNGLTLEQIERKEPGRMFTRLLVSPQPPYLLGRANLLVNAAGETVFVRERLELVDWAPQPLPISDFAAAEVWELDPEVARLMLQPDSIPQAPFGFELLDAP